MKTRKMKQGVEKVKFWLVILVDQLVAAAAMCVGGMLPRKITVPVNLVEGLLEVVWILAQPFLQIWRHSVVLFWFALALGLAISGMLLYLFHWHSPKKRKSLSLKLEPDLVNMQVLLYIGTAALFMFVGRSGGNVVPLMSFALGILTVSTAVQLVQVLQDVYVKRNSPDYVYFEENKKKVLIVTTAVGLALVGLPVWIPGFWGFSLPELMSNQDLLGYYTAQLSLTFISISVMGVLSDRSVVIYWENIAEGKLIKPVFGSFASYTYYSVGATVGAGISVALGDSTAFTVFFAGNIVTMILLTYTMVDVYYDREGKKIKREADLEEDFRDYLWVRTGSMLRQGQKMRHYINPETNEEYTPQEIRGMHIGYERYEEKMMLLCQNIQRANEEHDLLYLREVYDLYRRKLGCFNTPDGKRVVQMLFADCGTQDWPLLLKSMKAHLENLVANQNREEDPFGQRNWRSVSRWNQDEPLWAALVESQYLRKWLRSVGKDPLDYQELQDFMHLVLQRLVVLYNDMVIHSNCVYEGQTFDFLKVSERNCALWVETESGEKPDAQQIGVVFNDLFGEVVVETTFAARLMRVLYVMVENLDENPRTTLLVYLNDFPLPGQFTPYMPTLGFTEEEEAVWKEYFPAEE